MYYFTFMLGADHMSGLDYEVVACVVNIRAVVAQEGTREADTFQKVAPSAFHQVAHKDQAVA